MPQRDVFHAIADPTRRAIVDLLAQKPLPVSEVAVHFDISRPAVSRHIKVLNECGLVEIEPEGRKRWCRTEPEKLREVVEWAARYRSFWQNRLDRLGNELQKDRRDTQED